MLVIILAVLYQWLFLHLVSIVVHLWFLSVFFCVVLYLIFLNLLSFLDLILFLVFRIALNEFDGVIEKYRSLSPPPRLGGVVVGRLVGLWRGRVVLLAISPIIWWFWPIWYLVPGGYWWVFVLRKFGHAQRAVSHQTALILRLIEISVWLWLLFSVPWGAGCVRSSIVFICFLGGPQGLLLVLKVHELSVAVHGFAHDVSKWKIVFLVCSEFIALITLFLNLYLCREFAFVQYHILVFHAIVVLWIAFLTNVLKLFCQVLLNHGFTRPRCFNNVWFLI